MNPRQQEQDTLYSSPTIMIIMSHGLVIKQRLEKQEINTIPTWKAVIQRSRTKYKRIKQKWILQKGTMTTWAVPVFCTTVSAHSTHTSSSTHWPVRVPHWMLWWGGYYWCFVSGRSRVHIFLQNLAVVSKGFHGLPQSLQTNARLVPQIGPQMLPSISFWIRYSLIIQKFYNVQSDLLKVLLNKWHIHNCIYCNKFLLPAKHVRHCMSFSFVRCFAAVILLLKITACAL